MTRRGHGLRDLFHIDELPSEIRMLGEIGVLGIEIALRIEKNDVHGDVGDGGAQVAAMAL